MSKRGQSVESRIFLLGVILALGTLMGWLWSEEKLDDVGRFISSILS